MDRFSEVPRAIPRCPAAPPSNPKRTSKTLTLRRGEGVRIGQHFLSVERAGWRPQLVVNGPEVQGCYDVTLATELQLEGSAVRILEIGRRLKVNVRAPSHIRVWVVTRQG